MFCSVLQSLTTLFITIIIYMTKIIVRMDMTLYGSVFHCTIVVQRNIRK